MNDNIVLSLKDISKNYKQASITTQILKNISLDVSFGEVIAIIGASGSGKSTLLHIAGFLDNCESGEVVYKNGNNFSSDQIRLRFIGFIYQYHHLLKDFNARENVALPALLTGQNYKQALNRADELLDSLKLNTKLYNLPGELSGGEQQRVAIARSLINSPKVILADEPTGNLDPETADEVFGLFLKVAKERDTAVIMVTHNHVLAQRMHKAYELRLGSLYKLDYDTIR